MARTARRRRSAAQRTRRIVNGYVHNVQNPSLTVFRADPRHANGAAMIVIPGGGHRMLVFQNEGVARRKALNRYGITVFVLKYRLAREPGSILHDRARRRGRCAPRGALGARACRRICASIRTASA